MGDHDAHRVESSSLPIQPTLVTGPVPPPAFPHDLGGQQSGRGRGREAQEAPGGWEDLPRLPHDMTEPTGSRALTPPHNWQGQDIEGVGGAPSPSPAVSARDTSAPQGRPCVVRSSGCDLVAVVSGTGWEVATSPWGPAWVR